jgi:hypothetical protein
MRGGVRVSTAPLAVPSSPKKIFFFSGSAHTDEGAPGRPTCHDFTRQNLTGYDSPPDFFRRAYQTIPAAAAVPTPTAVAASTGLGGI